MDDLLKEGTKQAEGVLTEAYKDLLSPTLQPIGQIVSYIPRAIRVAAFGKLEKWIVNGENNIKNASNAIAEKLKDVPTDKLTDTEPYIVIPAIQQLSYCQDNEVLRNLYANLIASSMIIDKKPLVHPAFVDIIKQLTPDEAKFLDKLEPNISIFNPLFRIYLTTNTSNSVAINFCTDIAYNLLDYPQEIATYLNNLERLNIINIINKDIGKREKESLMLELFCKFLEPANEGYSYKAYHFDYFKLTTFGLNFIKTCCQ